MDINELKYILSLAEHKNFTIAAEACNISQSALSKHLSKVESELGGVHLFDRSTRPVRLTAAGEEFMQHARKITYYNDLMLSSMEKYKESTSNILRIGTIPVMGRFGFQHMIKSFKSTLPEASNVDIIDRPTNELLKLLKKNEIDIALLVPSSKDLLHDNLTYYPLMENELCLILNKVHPLSRRSTINLSEVMSETFALADEETGMYELCMQACDLNNVTLKNIKTFRNIETILDLVEEGSFMGLMTARLLSTYKRPDIRAIRLTHAPKTVIALAIKNTSSPSSMALQFANFALKNRILLSESE